MKIARRIYWDTTCWLAWLNNERHWPSTVLTGIQDVVYEVETNNAVLFTSAVTRGEIFFRKLDLDQKTMFAKLMRRTNVTEVSADPRVMDRASAIREYHAARGQRVLTPDAIHLATAILYKADEFQTMDGLGASGRKRGLLKLNLDVGGYNLMVINPYPRKTPPAAAVSIRGPLFSNDVSTDLSSIRAIELEDSPDESPSDATGPKPTEEGKV